MKSIKGCVFWCILLFALYASTTWINNAFYENAQKEQEAKQEARLGFVTLTDEPFIKPAH